MRCWGCVNVRRWDIIDVSSGQAEGIESTLDYFAEDFGAGEWDEARGVDGGFEPTPTPPRT